MFVMNYETDYGETGSIELCGDTIAEAELDAEQLADERCDIKSYSVEEV